MEYDLSSDQLAAINPGARPQDVAVWLHPLIEGMWENQIDTSIDRMAGFLASVANETAFLRATAEIGWFHTPWERANGMFGHACPPREVYYAKRTELGEAAWNEWFFNQVYDDRIRGQGHEIGGNVNDGDGFKFRARGPGITGRNNYRDLGQKLGVDLEGNPDLLLDPEIAAPAFARYWRDIGNNQRMDAKDFRGAMLAMNPGLKDSDLVQHDAHFARALKTLRANPKAKPPRPMPATKTEAAKQAVSGKTGIANVLAGAASAVTIADVVSKTGEVQVAVTASKGLFASLGVPAPYAEIVLSSIVVLCVAFNVARYAVKLWRGEAQSS